MVLETELLDAGFPPAIAAKRSSLLFTWKQKIQQIHLKTINTSNSKWHESSRDEPYLRQRCCGAALGRRLSGPSGTRGLCLPSISARLTRSWPDRLLHTELSDADTFTARSVHRW